MIGLRVGRLVIGLRVGRLVIGRQVVAKVIAFRHFLRIGLELGARSSQCNSATVTHGLRQFETLLNYVIDA